MPGHHAFGACLYRWQWELVRLGFIFFEYFTYNIYRGSTIAKIVGSNVKDLDWVENEVRLWVFEELIEGRKLSEIINIDHENIKYHF